MHDENSRKLIDTDKNGCCTLLCLREIIAFSCSLRRWYEQQTLYAVDQQQHGAARARQVARTVAQQRPIGNKEKSAAPAPAPAVAAVATPEGRTYTLVVDKSKALAEGRRFELPCGSNVVIGRSQHLAGIVVKDEMVRRCQYPICSRDWNRGEE